MRSAARSGLFAAGAAASSFQRATNTLVSCCPGGVARFDENASHWPSGENIGKPSKPSAVVIRSRFAPVTSTAQTSNSRGLGAP